tara:strand:+ start:2919 stop:3968 length:1050 start_codon:yes stop_codon:yes gene_type:complete
MSTLNVGTINATNINASGEIDTDGNQVLPNNTNASRPNSPDTGTMLYNTDENKVQVYNGSTYETVGTGDAPTQYKVQLWGAGGAGGCRGGWSYGANGGGGGYAYGELFGLSSGAVLKLRVGEGGLVNGTRMSYGGGGTANRDGGDNRYGSGGGGGTGLFLTSVAHSNAIMMAGGGGGGGSSRNQEGNWGGAGGGECGQDGASPYEYKIQYRGRAGSGTEGGANAQDGSSYSARALEGGTANSNCYGGAGGGGYYGGGAGGYSESNTMGGGGGGSGYINYDYVRNWINARGEAQSGAGGGAKGHPGGGVGKGGQANCTAGGHGYARIWQASNNTTTTYSYTGSDVDITVP